MQIIYNVTIYPVSATPINKGAVAVADGKVIAFGLAENGPASLSDEVAEVIRQNKATLVNGQNGSLTPGLIDAHTHLGIHEEGIGVEGADYNEMTDPVTPDLRAIDGIYPSDVAIREALQAGITTACVLPGSANVIGGQ
jgi:imidazolonepropionase-like amidohydrolase